MNMEKEYAELTANANSVPEGSEFKGRLKRPDDVERTFNVHEISQSDTQIIGLTRELGIPEWIVINLPSDKKDGTYRLVGVGQSLPPQSIHLGAVLNGAIVNYLDGTITIEQKPNGRFKASKFNFTFKSGDQEGAFTDGEVDIPSSE
jgi:hypothetical protein